MFYNTPNACVGLIEIEVEWPAGGLGCLTVVLLIIKKIRNASMIFIQFNAHCLCVSVRVLFVHSLNKECLVYCPFATSDCYIDTPRGIDIYFCVHYFSYFICAVGVFLLMETIKHKIK